MSIIPISQAQQGLQCSPDFRVKWVLTNSSGVVNLLHLTNCEGGRVLRWVFPQKRWAGFFRREGIPPWNCDPWHKNHIQMWTQWLSCHTSVVLQEPWCLSSFSEAPTSSGRDCPSVTNRTSSCLNVGPSAIPYSWRYCRLADHTCCVRCGYLWETLFVVVDLAQLCSDQEFRDHCNWVHPVHFKCLQMPSSVGAKVNVQLFI
jgi:hypothetical protein